VLVGRVKLEQLPAQNVCHVVLFIGFEHVVLEVGKHFADLGIHDLVLQIGVHRQQLNHAIHRPPLPLCVLPSLLKFTENSPHFTVIVFSRTMASLAMESTSVRRERGWATRTGTTYTNDGVSVN
jgi:hypothetical protein